MGIIDCASGASAWRGYDYYKGKKVMELQEIGEDIYSATVAGGGGNNYSVELNIAHPRKSKCNCPHANGKRIICKHIVATFFTVCPEEAEKYYKEIRYYRGEAEELEEQLANKVFEYVSNKEKNELSPDILELFLKILNGNMNASSGSME